MFQAYSDGVAVAASGTYPLNNVTYLKGCTATPVASGSVALSKRGVYNVQVDGFATLADAGEYSIQLARNGVALPQAISTTSVAATEIGSGSFSTLVVVTENDCCCNWASAPVVLSIINPSETAVTDAHINITVTKLI